MIKRFHQILQVVGILNASAPEVTGGVAGSVFAAANTIRAIGRVNLDSGLALTRFIKLQKSKDC